MNSSRPSSPASLPGIYPELNADLIPASPLPKDRNLFQIAIISGNTERVTEYLDQMPTHFINESITVINDAMPPISAASLCGHLEMVRLLINRGADPWYIYSNQCALGQAALAGNTDIIELLWNTSEIKSTKMKNLDIALFSAIRAFHAKVLGILLQYSSDLISDKSTIKRLFIEVERTKQDNVLHLILGYCASRHHEPILTFKTIQYCFGYGDKKLLNKIHGVYLECLKKLPATEQLVANYTAKLKMVEDEENTKKLFDGVNYSDINKVKEALDAGIHADARDHSNRTPLMYAVTRQSPDITRLLLDSGADPDALDADQEPVWSSTKMTDASREVLILIIERSKNPHRKHSRGYNLFRLSLEFKSLAVMEACMKRRISPYAGSTSVCLPLGYVLHETRSVIYQPLAAYMASFYQDKSLDSSPSATFHLILAWSYKDSGIFCNMYVSELLKLKGAVNVLANTMLTHEEFNKFPLSFTQLMSAIEKMVDPEDKLAACDYALENDPPNFFRKMLQLKYPVLGYKSCVNTIKNLRATLLAEHAYLESKSMNAKEMLTLLENAVKANDSAGINGHLERLAEMYLIMKDEQIGPCITNLSKQYHLSLVQQFNTNIAAMQSAHDIPLQPVRPSAPPNLPSTQSTGFSGSPLAFLPPPPYVPPSGRSELYPFSMLK